MVAKVTSEELRQMKGKEPIAALTAYDYPMARMLDELGVPLILVGDSLGMVVLGYPDTTHVTMEEMEHHVRAVARAKPRGLVVADLPFGACADPRAAARNALRLVEAGAEAVKAEGGVQIQEQVRAIVGEGIPFLGHIGMLPQHVLEEGGYRIKGKAEQERQMLMADAEALVEAKAFGIVLELVAPAVAREITARVRVPTIGIGSGPDCDGQILVTTDLLGTSPDYIPKHVKLRGDVGGAMRTVIRQWKKAVLNRTL